ncbi:MAG TPA: DedA family protein [Bacteroidetes bacterium]|nr:DedA family protein [Bacteroidota bacterium]
MMDSITIDLVEWIKTLPVISIYVAFFLIAYLENVIPPIPGDIMIVFGGYLAADGFVDFTTVLLLTTVASVFGFMSMYYVGYRWGDGIKEKRSRFWLFRYLDYRYMTKAQAWMGRWGQGVIVGNRFLAGTRSIISLISGISQTDIRKTILSSFTSSILWNFILLGSGWIIKENWEQIGSYLSYYSWVIFTGLAIFAFIKIRAYLKFKKTAKQLDDIS